uniref:Checkpoint protein n=1 Tax=Ixodes ricinus TaxID=34613 RepID=A0A0K8R836_IXORI
MKFRARIVDIVSLQQFTKIVHTISKLAKVAAVRITLDTVYFIVNEDAVSGGGFLWADVPQDTIFQEFNMQGVSEEFNEIYLDVVMEHLVRALRSSVAAKSLKIKLTKKQTPCLSLEIELIITHMPSLKALKTIVEKMRNLNTYVTIGISTDREMTMSVQTDMVTVTTHFKGLQFPVPESPAGLISGQYEVRLDLRRLTPLLVGQQLNPRQVTCKIIHKRHCHFIFDHDNGSLQCLLPCVYS